MPGLYLIDTKAAVMGMKDEMLLIEQRRKDDEKAKQQHDQHERMHVMPVLPTTRMTFLAS